VTATPRRANAFQNELGEVEMEEVRSGLNGRSSARGRRGWTGLGAAIALASSALTACLAMAEGQSPPTWLLFVTVTSPLIGALFGLLFHVVAIRLERNSLTDSTLSRAAADAARLAVRKAPPLAAGCIIEIRITRVPDGFTTVVHHRPGLAQAC
jgi:hypothetical protein